MLVMLYVIPTARTQRNLAVPFIVNLYPDIDSLYH